MFFEFIIQETVWGLASWCGMPAGIVKLLRAFYLDLTSTFNVNGHFGMPWKRTNDLAQGCFLSDAGEPPGYRLGLSDSTQQSLSR